MFVSGASEVKVDGSTGIATLSVEGYSGTGWIVFKSVSVVLVEQIVLVVVIEQVVLVVLVVQLLFVVVVVLPVDVVVEGASSSEREEKLSSDSIAS